MADNVDYTLASSEQIVIDLGARLAKLRLASNVTQAALASKAGVGTRTLARLEGGEGGTIDSLVRVITALGLRSHFEAVLPDPDIRPMERVQLRGRERQMNERAPRLEPSGRGDVLGEIENGVAEIRSSVIRDLGRNSIFPQERSPAGQRQ